MDVPTASAVGIVPRRVKPEVLSVKAVTIWVETIRFTCPMVLVASVGKVTVKAAIVPAGLMQSVSLALVVPIVTVAPVTGVEGVTMLISVPGLSASKTMEQWKKPINLL